MEKRTDILYFLKDHSIPPPSEVIEKILAVPEYSDASGFERLQDHGIAPPPVVGSAIRSGIFPRRNLPRIRLQLGAAAAVLFFIAGIGIYHFFIGGSRATRSTIVLRSKEQQHSEGRSLGARDTSARALTQDTRTSDTSAASGSESPALALILDGEQFPLTDNSLLATFASSHYPVLKKYISSKKTDYGWRIQLDQFTNINLSRAMIATLRELNDTRPDGSPGRKARKTRQRLEKWTEQDRKQFGPQLNANPLDAVDLAEFLFPPLFSFMRHSGHPAVPVQPAAPMRSANDGPRIVAPLTVSYSLTFTSGKSNLGIGEAYNGGLLTFFDDGRHARLRLASLMRIQSVFMSPDAQAFHILTESIKPQNLISVNGAQWSGLNGKYFGATRTFFHDTTRILGYSCNKALINLSDGHRITAWYTEAIDDPAQGALEPAFSGIPGLVLQYEYTVRRKTIRYTAVAVSRKPIDVSVFAFPGGR